MAKNAGNETTEAIRKGELYRIAEAKARLRLGDWAWRRLRREGLRIIRCGRQDYVLGDDLINHMVRSRDTVNDG